MKPTAMRCRLRDSHFPFSIFYFLFVALLSCGACGIDYRYVLPLVAGQATILLHSVPVAEAIRSGHLTEEQVAKLTLIQDAREYAGHTMGLNTADNYTLFFDGGEGGLAYNVSASHQYEFHPKKWDLPIVGVLPYLGFFDKAAALRKFEELQAQSYDAFLYEVDAYSTLDYFPNPILSPMLRRDELDLIETVMHELLHSTVWHEQDTTFNESLATFVGRTGALEYLATRYPDEPERVQNAVERYADGERYNTFIFELYGELDAFYSSGLSKEERIAGREAYYQVGRDRFVRQYQPLMNNPDRYAWVATMPTNNAWLLSNVRYNYDLDVYAQVHQATRGVWRDTLAVFREAARAEAPNAYLRDWLTEFAQTGSALIPGRTEAAGGPAASHGPPRAASARRGLCPRGTGLAPQVFP